MLRALALELTGSRGLRRNQGVGLLISGTGAERAAAAVETVAVYADASTCWINLGCAGGRGPIGELVAAHLVRDAAGAGGEAGGDWYPQFPFPVAENSVEVRTVGRPQTVYDLEGVVYEMEAAGFYRAALRRASLERVQVLKVRVDGPEHPLDRVTAERVEAGVADRIDGIRAWIDRLGEVARVVRARRPDAREVQRFLDRWHFTASQRVQLERALERMRARSIPLPGASAIRAADAGEVLADLRGRLAQEIASA